MAGERYPLQAAERLRHAQRTEAEQALAAALAARVQAQAALEDVARALAGHAARAPSASSTATIAALELQREAAFAQRHADDARALRARHNQAHAHLLACEREVQSAQGALGHARAAERAIERDHARFDTAQRREHERREQTEVDERGAGSRNDRGH